MRAFGDVLFLDMRAVHRGELNLKNIHQALQLAFLHFSA